MLVQIAPGAHRQEASGGSALGARTRRTADAHSHPPLDLDRIAVRPARIGDMREVEPLIRAFAADDLMLPKSFDQLARTFREFAVAVDGDGRIIGCGALRIYNEELAEICSLAIDLAHQRSGIGRLVVERLLENAREMQLRTVFALTLKADFFTRLGFRVVPKEDFPPKVWADCRSCPKLHACDEIAVAREI